MAVSIEDKEQIRREYAKELLDIFAGKDYDGPGPQNSKDDKDVSKGVLRLMLELIPTSSPRDPDATITEPEGKE